MAFSFGEILKGVRASQKVTLRELAKEIGKTIGYISDIEHNRKRPPDLETVREIESFLKAKPGTLVNMALEIRNKTPHNLSQKLKMRPILSEVLLRADNLSDKEIRELINQMEKTEAG